LAPLLSFQSVSKFYGSQAAVNQVSLGVERGEILSLLGPSGCGKTTLLRLAGGFEQPDQGAIFLEELDITPLPPDRRPLNMIFQNYALFNHLSVRANIAFGPKLTGWSPKQIKSETDRLLHLVQLEEQAERMPATLSGGQKQRVALARALIMKPRVLLLDEPFAALDTALRQRMLAELGRLLRVIGITFVFVTHDQSEAMSISHRVAVMSAGRIVQVGTPEQVYLQPRNAFVAAFLGETNFLEGDILRAPGGGFLLALGNLLLRLAEDSGPLEEGGRATLCLRPENLHLRAKQPAPGPGINSLAAMVVESTYLGPQSKYVVAIGDTRLTILQGHGIGATGHFHLTPGSPVWVAWHARSGRIMPAAEAPTDPPATASPDP